MAQPHHQPSTTLTERYFEFRQQVSAQPPTSQKSHPLHHTNLPHNFKIEEDMDMDAQLENVSPEKGGSFLQVSLGGDSIQGAQATPWKPV